MLAKGSGATVYGVQAGDQGITLNVTVDGGPPQSSVLEPIRTPTARYNATLFNVQSLASGVHNMTMTVLNNSGIFSGMMLDYVYVNQTFVAPVVSQSASASMTSATGPAATAANSSSRARYIMVALSSFFN
jgi:hypothetical protein